MRSDRVILTIDFHTAGIGMRLLTSGLGRLPGATIGVLGSGQLGRMFASAARRTGYRVHTLSPGQDTPTGQIADVEVSAAYEDVDAVRHFARAVDLVTFEFENVPVAAAEAAAEVTTVRPAPAVLHVTQQRVREKTFLARAGLPVTDFAAVSCVDELRRATRQGSQPCIRSIGRDEARRRQDCIRTSGLCQRGTKTGRAASDDRCRL